MWYLMYSDEENYSFRSERDQKFSENSALELGLIDELSIVSFLRVTLIARLGTAGELNR